MVGFAAFRRWLRKRCVTTLTTANLFEITGAFCSFAIALQEAEFCVTVGCLGTTRVQTLMIVPNLEDFS